MDLNKLAIKARSRSPWEAIDMGFVMTCRWWWLAFFSWSIPAVLIYILATIVMFKHALAWAGLLVWWLKPLLDRGPLFVASRRLFGDEPTLREILFALPSLYRTDWFRALTIYRFSPTRSFDMPLTVLENARGNARSARQAVLHRGHANAATWFTITAVHIEVIIWLGLYSFAYFMLYDFISIDLFSLTTSEQNKTITLINNSVYFFAMVLVAPFYAIGGFALYISRRIDLEAWDIEIRFRELAANASREIRKNDGLLLSKLAPIAFSIIVATGSCLAVKPAIANSSNSSHAEPLNTAESPSEEFRQTIAPTENADLERDIDFAKEKAIRILESDPFHEKIEQSGWRLKEKDTDSEESEWFLDFIEALVELFDAQSGIAETINEVLPILEVGIWVTVALLIIFLIYKYHQNIQSFVKPPLAPEAKKQPSPTRLFGLDVTKESLPDDIPAAVQKIWKDGDQRAAISLLYRGLLFELIDRYELEFKDSHTEGECLEIVEGKNIDLLTQYARSITRYWQSTAYGALAPDLNTIQHLCQQWPIVLPPIVSPPKPEADKP